MNGFGQYPLLCLLVLSPVPSAAAQVCSSGAQYQGYECTSLNGRSGAYVAVVDTARQLQDSKEGQTAVLSIINTHTGRLERIWPVSLGCASGAKVWKGDLRTPTGAYTIVQRRETLSGEPARRRKLGAEFLLMNYPTHNECRNRGYGGQRLCEEALGRAIGIHAGRRPGRCTDGCIRLTAPGQRRSAYIEDLVDNFVAGRPLEVLVSSDIHGSLYKNIRSDTVPECWRRRLSHMSSAMGHGAALQRLSEDCPELPPESAGVVTAEPVDAVDEDDDDEYGAGSVALGLAGLWIIGRWLLS